MPCPVSLGAGLISAKGNVPRGTRRLGRRGCFTWTSFRAPCSTWNDPAAERHVPGGTAAGRALHSGISRGAPRRFTWNSVQRTVRQRCLTTTPLKRARLVWRGTFSRPYRGGPRPAPPAHKGLPTGTCPAPPAGAQCEGLSRMHALTEFIQSAREVGPDLRQHSTRDVTVGAAVAHIRREADRGAGSRAGTAREEPLARALVFAERLAERGQLRSREPPSTGAAGAAKRRGIPGVLRRAGYSRIGMTT
jgi:hypothetical protein